MIGGVSLLAIIGAGVVSMIIGFLWYSPMLFGKQWMKLMGLTKEKLEKAKKTMGPMYGVSFVATFVMAVVLGIVVNFALATSAQEGMRLGFLMWLGFVAPVMVSDVIFGDKTWDLLLLNAGYQLVSLMAMGSVLAMWG